MYYSGDSDEKKITWVDVRSKYRKLYIYRQYLCLTYYYEIDKHGKIF
jgi:hypothetical protein